MLDTGLFAPGGRLSKALAQHHQASACDPLSQAHWTPACSLVRNLVVWSPCFKDSREEQLPVVALSHPPDDSLEDMVLRSIFFISHHFWGWWMEALACTKSEPRPMQGWLWPPSAGRPTEGDPSPWRLSFWFSSSQVCQVSCALWMELERLQAFVFGRDEASWGLGRRRQGPLMLPAAGRGRIYCPGCVWDTDCSEKPSILHVWVSCHERFICKPAFLLPEVSFSFILQRLIYCSN